MTNQEATPGIHTFHYQFHSGDNSSTEKPYLSSGQLIVEAPTLGLQIYQGYGVDSFGPYFLEGVQTRKGQLAGLKWYGDLRNHFGHPPIGQLLDPKGDHWAGRYFRSIGEEVETGTIAAFKMTLQGADVQGLEIDLPYHLPRPVRHFAPIINRFPEPIIRAMQEIYISFPVYPKQSR